MSLHRSPLPGLTAILAACAAAVHCAAAQEPIHYPKERYQTAEDAALAETMADREADWRNGAVVYQIIVDRFAPPSDPAAKAALYEKPRRLRAWEDEPSTGHPQEGTPFWSHELDFWGGDLESLTSKLGYIDDLGVDVVYLNPIQHAFTNHKYDAIDYLRISPEYGSREDVRALADALHQRGMKLVLDGVFNHMGKQADIFKHAISDPDSPYRDWFLFSDAYRKGFRSWADSPSLPELHLENQSVRDFLYGADDGVVQSYLRDGADGWRLDVAYDIGPVFLRELTQAAHAENPNSIVIGEIWSYPDGWTGALDGVMNFTLRRIILSMLDGSIDGRTTGAMVTQMVDDMGIEPMLKSWTLIDNHDTKRLRTLLDDPWRQNMAQTLQATLPGSPNFYYGVELGLEGGSDPANRGPMRWELATEDNPHLQRFKSLINLRRQNRALRIGNYRSIVAGDLLAFERYTDKALESVFVVANPSDKKVQESVLLRNHKMMNGTTLVDALTGEAAAEIRSSVVRLTVPPRTILVLKPVDFDMEWTPYERVY